MLSSGQVAYQPNAMPSGVAPTTGGYPQTSGYQMGGYPSFGPSFVGYNQPLSAGGGGNTTNLAVKASMTPGQTANYMWGNMIGSSVQNMTNSITGYLLNSQSMSAQLSIAQAYYKSQDTIAGYQKEVAIVGLGVQDHAITAQQSMHSEQARHEERMMQLAGAAQARIAGIQQDGMTARAKVMATVQDAFATRNMWSMGTPTYSV